MKLADEFEDKELKDRLPVLYMTIGVIAFVVLVFVIVLCVNVPKQKDKRVTLTDILTAQDKKEEEKDPIIDELGIGQSALTSDQLDFWDMYKKDEEIPDAASQTEILTMEEKIEKNARDLLEEENTEDLSEGGTKTMVLRPDGTEQWIMINAYITKNALKKEGFVYEEPIMKYYDQGEKQSSLGIFLDETCGTVIFDKVKNSGIDFVMLRVGFRGYESGQISYDEKFDEYARGATQAGLKIGVYFESQATNAEEATEEAQIVVASLLEREVTYPVALRMGEANHDTARTDMLAKSQVTEIANIFCQYIQDSGYHGLVYGNKYWLLRRMDLTILNGYDIGLIQEGQAPDYPYEMALWQYQNQGKIDGIACEVPLCISFIDYSKK